MSRVSIIVPSRNEPYLAKTVVDLFSKAGGDIEIIAVVDGPTEYSLPNPDSRLYVMFNEKPYGMRAAINSAAVMATGKYLMKVDAHVAIGEDFDEILQSNCDKDWIVSCRRHELWVSDWDKDKHEPVDYFYLSCPWTHRHFIMQSCPWVRRTRERHYLDIDDQMTIHGAVWFMHTEYFRKNIGYMNEEGYGGFAGEPLELCMKAWLSGGRVVVNKNTWYAHSREGPHYSVQSTHMMQGLAWSAHYWSENKWDKRIHDFDWLVDKFWPLPLENTRCHGEKYYWPENWREHEMVC